MWKRHAQAQKSLHFHINHMHSEVSEVFEELRDWEDLSDNPEFGGALQDVRYDKDGHPEGFAIELADVVLTACYIADLTGIDLEAMMELKMTYNETKNARER